MVPELILEITIVSECSVLGMRNKQKQSTEQQILTGLCGSVGIAILCSLSIENSITHGKLFCDHNWNQTTTHSTEQERDQGFMPLTFFDVSWLCDHNMLFT